MIGLHPLIDLYQWLTKNNKNAVTIVNIGFKSKERLPEIMGSSGALWIGIFTSYPHQVQDFVLWHSFLAGRPALIELVSPLRKTEPERLCFRSVEVIPYGSASLITVSFLTAVNVLLFFDLIPIFTDLKFFAIFVQLYRG